MNDDDNLEEFQHPVATYGKQLGLITEVLLDLAQQVAPTSPKARESVARLAAIRDEIDNLKDAEYDRLAEALVEQLRQLQRSGGNRAKALEARLRPLLAPPAH